ncbi:MAG: DivIVA domain-containing protein [Myxococcota bacterium]
MRLTPGDVRQQKFRSVVWGVDGAEVEAYLEVVASDFDFALRDAHRLRDELQRKESEIDAYRERERALKETMMTATRITEQIKGHAQKEAELIIAQAETDAQKIIQTAHARLARVTEDIAELRRQKTQFEATVRSAIMAHSRLIDSMSDPEAAPGGRQS